MFRSTLIAVAAVAVVANAQNTTVEPTGNSTYFYGADGSLEIDPNTVDASLRSAWCLGQTNNCPEVCGGQVTTNTCDAVRLPTMISCSSTDEQLTDMRFPCRTPLTGSALAPTAALLPTSPITLP